MDNFHANCQCPASITELQSALEERALTRRVVLRVKLASRPKVPMLWLENETGERWVPGMAHWDEHPPGFIYQRSRFPVLREQWHREVLQSEVDACPHTSIKPDFGIIDTMEGRECLLCHGYQSKHKGEPWPDKWEAHGTRMVAVSESSWSDDLVLAMVRPSLRELRKAVERFGTKPRLLNLSDAVIIAATSCERCLNGLLWRYGQEDGYIPYGPAWDAAGTRCSLCEHPIFWDWVLNKPAGRTAAPTPHQRGWERRREKDDRTERNIPPEYLALWRKLKVQFKGTPDQRAEQFMEWVERHPDESGEVLQQHADRTVAGLIQEQEKERRRQVQVKRDCEKKQTRYENAWYKEQERQTKEKRTLRQLREKADAVCETCPTCHQYEEQDMVPFAASLRVLAKYKGRKHTDAGNTVYVYSERQIALRNRRKADQIAKLEKSLGNLRKKVQRDLRSDDPDTMLTALAVALMDHTYERVGNDESADDGHFGVTGWQRKHVSFSRGKATVRYVGKAGVKHEKVVSDKAITMALRNAYEASEGDDACLFWHDRGKVGARKVNEYLKEFGVTAKDIRGLHANREMRERLTAIRREALPSNRKAREKQLKAEFLKALEATAEAVGHEPATLRSQYLVPGLEEEYVAKGTVLPLKKAAKGECYAH